MMNQLPKVIYGTLAGQIDQNLSTKVFNSFAAAANNGVETIHMLMQSTGGVIGEGVGLYNYLRHLPLNIICYNGGTVASVAVVVFLAAKSRKASATAHFMIHKAYHLLAGSVPARSDHLEAITHALRLEDERLERIIFEQVKLPRKYKEIHKYSDLTLSSKDAFAFGLIDEIADFSPPPGAQVLNLAA
jgi:ATP-dependent Clp protease protease subunit